MEFVQARAEIIKGKSVIKAKNIWIRKLKDFKSCSMNWFEQVDNILFSNQQITGRVFSRDKVTTKEVNINIFGVWGFA